MSGLDQTETSPSSSDQRIDIVRAAFKSYQDFPKPGIVFQDIFAVFANPTALEELSS